VSQGIFDDVGALIELAQLHGAKVYIPDPVVHLLEAYVFFHQHRGDVNPAMLPADAAVVADEAALEMGRVFHLLQGLGEGPW